MTEQILTPKPSQRETPLKLWHFVTFCVAGFACVVAATYTIGSWTPSAAGAEPTLIAEFSGSGDARTDEFDVDDAWELRWHHTGRIEKLEWRTSEGRGSMVIDMHRKPIREQGGVNWPEGGRYRVDVTADGEWTLQIYQFKN